jgi:hypothetical protein
MHTECMILFGDLFRMFGVMWTRDSFLNSSDLQVSFGCACPLHIGTECLSSDSFSIPISPNDAT